MVLAEGPIGRVVPARSPARPFPADASRRNRRGDPEAPGDVRAEIESEAGRRERSTGARRSGGKDRARIGGAPLGHGSRAASSERAGRPHRHRARSRPVRHRRGARKGDRAVGLAGAIGACVRRRHVGMDLDSRGDSDRRRRHPGRLRAANGQLRPHRRGELSQGLLSRTGNRRAHPVSRRVEAAHGARALRVRRASRARPEPLQRRLRRPGRGHDRQRRALARGRLRCPRRRADRKPRPRRPALEVSRRSRLEDRLAPATAGFVKTERSVPLAALVTLVLIWGYSWVVMKIALRHAHPFDFAAVRVGLRAVLLFAIVKARSLPLTLSRCRMALLLGLLQVALFVALAHFALLHAGPGKTSVLVFTMPFWMIVFAHFIIRERMRGAQWIAVALAFTGLVLIVAPWQLTSLTRSLLAVGAGAVWAIAAVLSKRVPTPVAVPWILTAWQLLF